MVAPAVVPIGHDAYRMWDRLPYLRIGVRHAIDSVDHVLSETRTADPTQPATNASYLPASSLPVPLATTSSVTQGADLDWVPMPFTQSLSIAYERTHHGTGYFIHHAFADTLSPTRICAHPARARRARRLRRALHVGYVLVWSTGRMSRAERHAAGE